MRNTISIIALSIVATAGLSTPAMAAGPAKAKAVKYCVDIEPSTGTRIHHTDCMTKAEWAARGVDVDELLAK